MMSDDGQNSLHSVSTLPVDRAIYPQITESDSISASFSDQQNYSNFSNSTLDDNEHGMSHMIILKWVGGFLVTAVTFFGNVLVFVVVSHDPRLRTPSNYFIISLAISDLLISLISMPVWTVYSTLGYWPLSQLWCDLWNALDYTLCTVSMYTIVFISIDRYLSLRYPLTYMVKKTPRRAKMALVLIWITDLVVFCPFMLSTQYVYGTEHNIDECTTHFVSSPIITIFIVIFVLWLGVGGTSIVYCLIFNIVMKAGKIKLDSESGISLKKIRPKDKNCSSDDVRLDDISLDTVISPNSTASQSAIHDIEGRENKERRALRTIALLLLTCAVCWLPISFILLIETFKPGYLSVGWLIAAYWLGYANSMLNPVCYAIANPYFRETLIKILER